MSKDQDAVHFVKSEALPPTVGYSHAVEIRRGRMIYVAGQVSMDPKGNLVGPGDFRAQTTQVFENIKAVLAQTGATFTDVVKLNYYIKDTTQLPVLREVRDKYVNVKNPPVSTAVGVNRLVREEWLLEVEAVAVVPE